MTRSAAKARQPVTAGDKPTFQVAVRTLVDFLLRCGDLRLNDMAGAGALEGIRAHQRVQQRRPDHYQAEVPVQHTIHHPSFDLSIGGRIDGVLQHDNGAVVEEIKTTRRPLKEVAAAPSPVHWGQAQCYAYLWGMQEGLATVEVHLTYVHAESGKERVLARSMAMADLTLFFEGLMARYLPWLERHAQWLRTRDQSLKGLAFPFGAYRTGQREMAVAVYRAVRDAGHAMIQAATGIGKTMAALFPAIKALGEGHASKVAFLTARTTGCMAARDALRTLAEGGMRLKWVVLTAKEKICLSETFNCDPEACPFAQGYYDRLNDALAAALAQDALHREAIETLAREHRVCPFAFSLELLDWVDCMVGDYNYAFDPHVVLRRLFGDEGVRPAVLVDEAHNLVDRAREMFSARLDLAAPMALRRRVKDGAPGLHRALGPIQSWMRARRDDCRAAGGTCVERCMPGTLVDRLWTFMGKADRWLRRNPADPLRMEVLDFFFQCHRFVSAAAQDADAYAAIARCEGRDFEIKLYCLDPSFALQACWRRCGGAALFSATLTPADYFCTTLGLQSETVRLALASPFPRDNLAVFVTPRISTLYRQRADSCAAVTRTIGAMVCARPGNYLLFFPSYDYLAMVHHCFCECFPQMATLVQTSGMAEVQREDFLSRFDDSGEATLVGFAVMGGIFGEGIDLKGERLSGAAIVGVGLPGIGTERELIREHFDRTRGSGFAFAYQYPGINRVLQAAGRVIRSESDRGAVLLVDQRFLTPRYRSLLPSTWHVQQVADAAALGGALADFWRG
ncbi:helicase C-terminal domain-containing protein [Desulfatitalea alkaliphila]|uniref:PD-(D/E)XK nuclease family protein n=1 Tax=Desulfatitalea alkaliphila TaxID=2929485 RepID=A0AA41UNP0_9BACT|nr:helicase C-terminal domain-containing protein [Desulfatitalea alkaliphila]MCJ8499693.1 PD-(D/E)XK nuclease family protein [Desulfatitalea alkaliphila]